MLTNEEAEMLLKMPKWIVGGSGGDAAFLSHCALPLSPGQGGDFPLVSEDGSQAFRLVVKRKRALKMTLHHQTSPGDIGLLRVDYGGKAHTNPDGARIRPGVAHIHRYVEGFKRLAWAVPLSADSFSVKAVSDDASALDATRAFGRAIALMTEIAAR